MGRRPKTLATDTSVKTNLQVAALDIITATALEKGSDKLPKCIFKAYIPQLTDFIQDITVVSLEQNTVEDNTEIKFRTSKNTFMEVAEKLSEKISQSPKVPYKLPQQGYFMTSNTRVVPYPSLGQNNLLDLKSLPEKDSKDIQYIRLDDEEQIVYFVLATHRSIYLNDINSEISNRYYCAQYPGYYNIATFKYPEVDKADFTKVLYRPRHQFSKTCQYTARKETTVQGSWTTIKEITEDIKNTKVVTT